MIITMDKRMEIKSLLLSDSKIGMRELFKLKNSNLERVEDKYYVLFSLALMNKRERNMDLARAYIEELKPIMDKASDSYRMDKAMTLWLYIELHKDISRDDLLRIYKNIYENIKHLGEDDEKVLGVVGNIHILNNEYDSVLIIFDICLQRQYIETIDSILNEFREKNQIYYRKAMLLKSIYDINNLRVTNLN